MKAFAEMPSVSVMRRRRHICEFGPQNENEQREGEGSMRMTLSPVIEASSTREGTVVPVDEIAGIS